MSYKRIAVLRGGPSEEYEVSMRTGKAVLDALVTLGYPFTDIVITRKGEWLVNGVVRNPHSALEAIDVVFIALHGAFGEDGQLQRMLEHKKIPFTGSGSLASALAFNKHSTKEALRRHKIRTPRHKVLRSDDLHTNEKISLLFKEIGGELFIKPVASGSSHGARYIPDRSTLETALRELFAVYDELLVEEYVRGKEATVGVLENFRNTSVYTLPVIEIIPPNGDPLWGYEDKYNGKTREICPGRFSYSERAALQEAAALIHTALNCSHYSRSDFLVRDGEIFFLEINTLPGFTDQSLYPKAAAEIGLTFSELVRHLIETARV